MAVPMTIGPTRLSFWAVEGLQDMKDGAEQRYRKIMLNMNTGKTKIQALEDKLDKMQAHIGFLYRSLNVSFPETTEDLLLFSNPPALAHLLSRPAPLTSFTHFILPFAS